MTSIDCTPAATAGLRQATTRDWMTPLELTVLGAIWGASFLFMRVAANDFGAVPLVEMRLGLGALVLLPFLWRSRAHFPRALWPKLALIGRSEEHTSELQSLMRISYAVFCLKKKNTINIYNTRSNM